MPQIGPVEPPARILLVEDDLDVRTSLAEALSELGYVVDEAGNGVEALERLRSSPRPDVILLDLMMPLMDGWTFRALQLEDPLLASIPVVVLSASLPPGIPMADLSVDGVLEKPFGLDRLADALGRVDG
jgi:CheY-like chemotaxis protein